MRKKKWIFIMILVVFSQFTMGEATEARQTETTGDIGFTGVYKPIGTPNPTPPESIVRPPITEVANPGGTLPQTNEMSHSWHIWLGIFLISIVFLLWKRQNNQNTKLNQ